MGLEIVDCSEMKIKNKQLNIISLIDYRKATAIYYLYKYSTKCAKGKNYEEQFNYDRTVTNPERVIQ